MKNFQIRPAVSDDYSDIVQLIGDPDELFLAFPAGRWPFTVRQVHRLAGQRLDLTVAVDTDRVIGFANLYDKQANKWAYIGNVIVDRQYRGRGLGRRLVSHMLDLVFLQHDLPEARISVFRDNHPALALYRELGFSQFADEPRTTPDGRRVELLHLRLLQRGNKARVVEPEPTDRITR